MCPSGSPLLVFFFEPFRSAASLLARLAFFEPFRSGASLLALFFERFLSGSSFVGFTFFILSSPKDTRRTGILPLVILWMVPFACFRSAWRWTSRASSFPVGRDKPTAPRPRAPALHPRHPTITLHNSSYIVPAFSGSVRTLQRANTPTLRTAKKPCTSQHYRKRPPRSSYM